MCPFGKNCEVLKNSNDERYVFVEYTESGGERDKMLMSMCPYAHGPKDYRNYHVDTYAPSVSEDGKRSCSLLATFYHPDRYRTAICNNGENCPVFCCPFAHGKFQQRTPEQNWEVWKKFNETLSDKERPVVLTFDKGGEKKHKEYYKFPEPVNSK